MFSIGNASGFRADISDFGATLVRLFAPDRRGNFQDVVLGFDYVAGYEANPFFIGATIGRFANRIAHGRFTLDGASYQLSLNDGPPNLRRHLHGGPIGFHKRRWNPEPPLGAGNSSVRLSLRSPDGDEGYPGNLDVTVEYSIPADRNELRIQFTSTTDRATPVNFTNHSYFNLNGDPAADILSHVLKIEAAQYTPVNREFIPLGNRAPVSGTPFDFRQPHEIGSRIAAANEQLELAGGYDHNFVLDSSDGTLALAASVREPASGCVLEVFTTEPGLQFYSGNFLDGSWTGKSGRPLKRRSGFCLETQHFPDSPNQPSFPSTILRPGQIFRSATVYRLGTFP